MFEHLTDTELIEEERRLLNLHESGDYQSDELDNVKHELSKRKLKGVIDDYDGLLDAMNKV